VTVRVQFRLRDEVARRLAEQAAARGISRQAHVQDLIMETAFEETIAQDPVGRGVQKLARAISRPAGPYTRERSDG